MSAQAVINIQLFFIITRQLHDTQNLAPLAALLEGWQIRRLHRRRRLHRCRRHLCPQVPEATSTESTAGFGRIRSDLVRVGRSSPW